jgi:amino acid transporter
MTERLLPGTALDIEKDMRLKPGQVGFGTVLFQSLSHIAPALALIFALTVGVQYAGAALPLSTVLGFIGIMAVAYSVGQLARVLPAAGYYMTWTGKSISPKYGFMAGWFVLMSEAIPMGGLYLIMGTTFGAFLGAYASFSINWLIIDVVLAAAVGFLLWRGLRVSGTAGVILGTLELVIIGALIVWLIIKSGSHNTLSVFTPGAPGVKHGWIGVLRAVIYTVPTFAGFETAAVLAEESREPRRFIPRVIVVATFACGVFFVAGAYAGVIAWGPTKIAGYFASSNAWQALAHNVWGFAGALLVFLALVNSIAGNSTAEATASTRLMYAMGRIGSLPRWFGAVRSNRRVPLNAILVVTLGSFAISVITSYAFGGPEQGFAFTISLGAIFAILLYMSACISVPFLYLRQLRPEFNVLKHLVIPVIGVLVFIGPLISTIYPVPPYPLNIIPYIDLGWLLVGLGVLAWLWRNRRDSVIATQMIVIEADPADEPVAAAAPTAPAVGPAATEGTAETAGPDESPQPPEPTAGA